MTATQWCSAIGSLFILAGTVFAAGVIFRERRDHHVTWPVAGWAKAWVRRLLRRPAEVHVVEGTAAVSVTLTADAYVRMDGSEPLERLGPWVVQRLDSLRVAIRDARDDARRGAQEIRQQVETVERALDQQCISARERVAEGSSRQMWSLVLIGGGTVITLVPGVLGW